MQLQLSPSYCNLNPDCVPSGVWRAEHEVAGDKSSTQGKKIRISNVMAQLICDSGSEPLLQVEKCIKLVELRLYFSDMLAGSKSIIMLDGGEPKDLRETVSWGRSAALNISSLSKNIFLQRWWHQYKCHKSGREQIS